MTEKKAPAPNPNMELWNRLCKTNPAHTKAVNQRGGFTAIGAHSQIMAATEEWGPCGGRWGFSFAWIPDPDLWVAEVTLRYPSRGDSKGGECVVAQVGAASRAMGSKVDSDAPKKAITDGLTKCLSYTGMNADVFMGKFDDNKYVAAMREEFAAPPPPSSDPREKGQARIRHLCGQLCADDPRAYFQNLAADLGFPSITDNMTDDQFATIVAELEDRWERGTPSSPPRETPETERALYAELSRLAKVKWGADWFDDLEAFCDGLKINFAKASNDDLTRAIGVLSGQPKEGR